LKRKSLWGIGTATLLIGSGLFHSSAQAGYDVTLLEHGSDIVATGSGTLDLTDLTFVVTGNVLGAQMDPNEGLVITGPTSLGSISAYSGFTGPANFGSGSEILANSGTGDLVAVSALQQLLEVPVGYVSGGALSDTATYDNQTFSNLGVTPGTYEWTWGTGAHADSFTLQIGAAPAPLIGRGLPVLLVVGSILLGAKLLERSTRHPLHFG
jgi:hypothetical protein